jgi:chemotaxis protein CheD
MSILHLGPEARQTIAVGMGELVISADPEAALLCMGLGSCIAVCLYAPRRRVGALAHVVLPTAPAGSTGQTARYADQAIPLLVNELRGRGVALRGVQAVLCGGAAIFPPSQNSMDIGARNLQAITTELARVGLPVAATAVGGTVSRTITLHVATGLVHIRTVQDKEPQEIDLGAMR